MLTLYEFTIFGLYLATLLAFLVTIQVMNPGKAIREAMEVRYEESKEKFAELEFEEPPSESDEDVSFDPAKESFTMTENPMLRHRKVDTQDEVTADLEKVD